MRTGKYIKSCLSFCLIVLLSAVLPACGKEKTEEVTEKNFGVDFVQGQAISDPEQIICGQEYAWAITAAKDGYIYQLGYASDTGGVSEISWQQGENESLVNIAQRNGVLYAQVYITGKDIFEVRKYVGGNWLKVTSFEAKEREWKDVGGGFYVDDTENVYLASQSKVTCIGERGQLAQEYRLGGNASFFLENTEGSIACIAVTGEGIALYDLRENGTEKQWELTVPALRPVGLVSNSEDIDILCLATEEEILFIDPTNGSLCARSSLTACGVLSVLGGVYDVQKESLRLYGKENNGNLCYSLLSERDGRTEQRTELIYGTMMYMGVTDNVQAAIVEFNQTNEDYYVTIKNYNTMRSPDDQDWNWWDDLFRLQADMAGGNAPDIIEMEALGRYKSYAKNGYLEDLTPYLEQSPYRDDIIWNVLDGFRLNGGLYLMVPHYAISGVVIHPEYEGMVENWNSKTMFDLIEANQWEKALYNVSGNPEYVLENMLRGGLNDFVDWERKEASFETKEFLDMLTLCKESGEQKWPDMSEWQYSERRKHMLISRCYMYSYSAYLGYVDVFGNEYPVYGYPYSSGQIYGVSMQEDGCAIYAGSKHKEGAWAFIESLLGDGNQMRNAYEFPIRSSMLKKLEEAEKESIISIDNSGEKQLTEAQIDIVNELIYHADFAYTEMDGSIRTIIEEEAAAYFAGDKSAEEVAHIIQSRVQIILSE